MSDIINIYHDGRGILYVERISGKGKPLPEGNFLKFCEDPKNRERLCAAYPDKAAVIKGATAGASVIEDVIEPLIAKYNETVNKARAIVRWYKLTDLRLERIDEKLLPETRRKIAVYEGEKEPKAIVCFMQKLREELIHKDYAVFECPDCRSKQYGELKKNWVNCKVCGRDYNLQEENRYQVNVRQQFCSEDSAQNAAGAIACWIKWRRSFALESEEETLNVRENKPYYLDGEVYGISCGDCDSLHQELYRRFAYEQVFYEVNGEIRFTPQYERYVKSLSDYGVNKTLYRRLRGVVADLNGTDLSFERKDGSFWFEKAFYWYMRTVCPLTDGSLIWRLSEEVVRFTSKSQFVLELLSADEERQAQLVELYVQVTDLSMKNNFFEGYGKALIELSWLIYQETGEFVYFSEGKLVNFGKDFIKKLHKQDGLIALKNDFLEEIKKNCEDFWQKIMGSFSFEDTYADTVDGTYYDRLCYYQYVMLGKRELRYKDVLVSDSKDGVVYIRDVVCECYLSGKTEDGALYRELRELLSNELLWSDENKLPGIKAANTDSGMGKRLTFEELRTMIVNDGRDIPSLKLYLACADMSSKTVHRLRFWYKGKRASLLEHIKHLIYSGRSQTLAGEVRDFYGHPDVKMMMECIFNHTVEGGFEQFIKESQRIFEALKKESEQLNTELNKKRKDIMDKASSGRGSPEAEARAVSPAKPKPVYPKADKKMKKENSDDEWS